ncbi:prolyl oligopeptidase family serine peptidase [Roseiterribacter gracilis]|uniref:prolyl oligopeptidase n=1 Tax=Roseiterribacter gracilis TaxID=2812848 RepID=A0A8S8XD66_9PROT|nr:peptidase S9 [Rhodospirillales bacterium TMPK1]
MRLPVLAFATCIAAPLAAFAADQSAPPTATVGVTDTIQGVTVADPYRWLENADDPKVKAWSDAQNARARSYLDALPTRAGIKSKLTQLITQTSSAFYALDPRPGVVFAMFNDPPKQQPMLVVLNENADPDSRRVVLDPNVLDVKGGYAIDWFVPSPDGSKIAVSLSQGGSEDGTLHVYDVVSGKEIEAPIPRVQYPTAGGSAAWTRDGTGFWYTRFPGDERPESERHFHQQAYFHKLGDDWKKDVVVLGAKQGLPRVAEIVLDNRAAADTVLASVQKGDGGEWEHWLLKRGAEPVRFARFEDRVVAASIGGDNAIYAISRQSAPMGKVLKLSLDKPSLKNAKVIVAESNVAIVTNEAAKSLALTKDRLFVHDIIGGPSQVRVFDHDGNAKGVLPVPEIAGVDDIEPLASGDVLYAVSTYLRPRYYVRWRASTGKADETKLAVTSPVTFDDAEVVREFATSKDGTKIPVNIIRKKGIKLDGTNPALLYGYGGYGVNQEPYFAGPRTRLLLDGGGVYAIANIRGGAEYGEKWHLEGNLLKKQNVFDDFYAAAQHLIARGYTRSDKLALMGGSNGGLLMGATVTQHPDLARAVISSVGIYDMLRVELDPNGEFNVTEFGSVKNKEQFKALYAYSPYHRIKPDTNYPAMLLMTGANDGRVNPMQSRKFTGAIQAATKSNQPILLRTSANSGHGIGSALSEKIDQQADMLGFLFDQLGMRWTDPAPPPTR